MYQSQDTFRGTEFQYFFGYLPGGTFGGFRLPWVPQRGRFWLHFPHFWGSGRTCRNSTLSHAKPSFSTPGGVQNAARDPLFSKALFQEGPRAGLFRILVISGPLLGSLGDHFWGQNRSRWYQKQDTPKKSASGGAVGNWMWSGMGGDSLRNPGKDYEGKLSPRLAAGPWPGAAYI